MYDWRCAAGHVHEAEAGRDERTRPCTVCRRQSQRQLAVAGIMGMVTTPTRVSPINVTRFVEAQHTLVHESQRRGIDIPDPLTVARERIKRGDVAAIT